MSGRAERVALVTGGGSGIGEAVARRFAADGCAVVVADIDAAGAERVAADLPSSVSFVGDLCDPEVAERMVQVALSSFGQLDVAANVAGIGGPLVPTHEYPIDEWRRVIDVDLNAVYYSLRAELGVMVAAGTGAIVNMGSMFSTVARGSMVGYVAAKHGVLGLTRAAALDSVQHGIRINCVGPAVIDTPLLRGALDVDGIRTLEALNPMDRLGTTGEVASLVAWLCSNEAGFTTGGFYPVDGGFTAR